jgi:DNA gyrase subunit A
MIINLSGIIIRMGVNDLRVMGRATQGVRLINLKDDDGIAAVAKVECEIDEVDEDELLDGTGLLEGENNDAADDDTDQTDTRIPEE